MIDDPVPFRRVAQIALEQWFRQRDCLMTGRFQIVPGDGMN